ncbi:craniofacial development protein 1 [Drosophila teissieri]|uniref:craniofacial development protein 1-like n=1 Tax=Drosophila teissieri TaxID=7243 RepID=UPI001CBA4F01|nr:craniofacial development protein 1-like [Drosophila teissieri]XP_043662136.1 craniofacial development protein 1 [Drosophila teissieri]
MNLEEVHASDCESDDDFYVDFVTLSKGSKRSKISRVTRHSAGDNSDYKSKECDDLISEEESDKSRSDALWADFLGGDMTESVNNQKTNYASENSSQETRNKNKNRGTEIKTPKHGPKKKWTPPISISKNGKIKRPSAENGIGSIMNKLEKKKNLTVLERSQLDWKIFKQDEGIDELLCSHNKGKGGYLDRQDFLQRTDLRQFEIEKNLRLSRRPY